jgi:hypothetical protein
MLRNLSKGARLVKVPARLFGAVAHHDAHHAPSFTIHREYKSTLSAEDEKQAKQLDTAAWGTGAVAAPVAEYKFPEFQIDYNDLHFINPQIQYTEQSEPFIYAPLEPSMESQEALLREIMANAEPAYNETIKAFPATAAGEKDKADFIELFEPLVYPEKFVDPANPVTELKPVDEHFNGVHLPHPEMSFKEYMLFPFLNGNNSNKMNYAVGLLLCGVSAGYVFYRGIAEISELFDLMAHGHDHGHEAHH